MVRLKSSATKYLSDTLLLQKGRWGGLIYVIRQRKQGWWQGTAGSPVRLTVTFLLVSS